MFTGIVEEVGEVVEVFFSPIFQLSIKAKRVTEDLSVSDSICINGVCLTVTKKEKDIFVVEVMSQTLKKTNLGQLKFGDKVNLERALLPTSRLGGHIVTGDVDGLAQVERIEKTFVQWTFTLRPPVPLMKYIVSQGRVALEGVSLTVAEKGRETFKVCLIPYTIDHTNLKYKKEKDILNLEVDILAKHIEQILQFKERKEITLEFLRQAGY